MSGSFLARMARLFASREERLRLDDELHVAQLVRHDAERRRREAVVRLNAARKALDGIIANELASATCPVCGEGKIGICIGAVDDR